MGVSKTKTTQGSIKVINDRVLIEPETNEYKGMLELPEEYAGAIVKSAEWGRIASFGDKCTYKWKVGMRVHFARLASVKFKIMDKEYCMVREYDIDLYEND